MATALLAKLVTRKLHSVRRLSLSPKLGDILKIFNLKSKIIQNNKV